MPSTAKTKKPAAARAAALSAPVKAPEKMMRTFQGTVLSNAMQKTIVVGVDEMKRHPKYHKSYRVTKKFHVHDEKNAAKPGNVVEFVECRPLSKTKRWRLSNIVK